MIKQDEECGGTKLQHIQLNLGGVGGGGREWKAKIENWWVDKKDEGYNEKKHRRGWWVLETLARVKLTFKLFL